MRLELMLSAEELASRETRDLVAHLIGVIHPHGDSSRIELRPINGRQPVASIETLCAPGLRR
jgi:hypothetical protein